MKTSMKKTLTVSMLLLTAMAAQHVHAAIALDRTRVIVPGDRKSVSLSVENQNKTLPYLAQTWVEDEDGNKIDNPFMAIPPIQRIEPGEKGQIKLQGMSDINKLPQDRESLFYFNVREIPPKSAKPNTLQIALQTRVKLFYRPASVVDKDYDDAQKALTLTRKNGLLQLDNPTPYYVTISGISAGDKSPNVNGFKPVMVPPKSTKLLEGNTSAIGDKPVLSFINDYGGRPKLFFSCHGAFCKVESLKMG